MRAALRSFSPRSFLTYAAIGVAGTALFFFLHHLGNQLPYELAEQRFETAFKEGNLAPTYSWGMSPEAPRPVTMLRGLHTFDECQTSLMILRGGKQQAYNTPSLFDAVLLKSFENLPEGYCAALASVASDKAELGDRLEKTRYWWGGKALHAVALRWFSFFEIKELTKTATYFAYLLLAVFLVRFYPRMLWFFLPLIVFGFFLSGIRYLPDSSAGLTYLWAVLSAAGLVWLAGNRASQKSLHLFCFVAGMVSSFLWILDGHTLFIMAFIGLFVYFALGSARFAVSCIALYIIGFLVCFTLGQLTKFIVFEWLVHDPVLWSRFYGGRLIYESGWVSEILFKDGVGKVIRKGVNQFGGLAGFLDLRSLFRMELVGSFWALGLEMHHTAAKVLTALSVLALTGSAGFAVVQARKGETRLLRDIAFVFGMLIFIYFQTLSISDQKFVLGRYLFVPYSLCWMSLILVIMNRRHCGNIGAAGGATCIKGSKARPGGGKYGAA